MKIVERVLQTAGILLLTLVVTVLLMAVWMFNQPLWHVMDLMVIPIVLVIGGYLLNRAQRQNEQAISRDQENARALQNYFDSMTELLLKEGLRTKGAESEVRSIAVSRTCSTLWGLDGVRRASVLRFLHTSQLISVIDPIVSLREATLYDAYLQNAGLQDANLSEAGLTGANLQYANLRGSDLSGADLRWANLCGANLEGANLNKTRYNHDTVWPQGFDPVKGGAVKA